MGSLGLTRRNNYYKSNKNIAISIIVPAKYEESTIIKTLEKISQNVKTPHEVVVVNDSYDDDKTGEIVLRYAKEKKNIRVLLKRNSTSTFASAVLLGFSNAKGEFIILVMADLCDNLRDIDKMYKKIQEGFDVVCGSRYMKGGKKIGGPLLQSVSSRFVCLSLQLLLRLPTHDISNSYKMYRKSFLRGLHLNKESGMEISMEMGLQLFFKKARMTQIPTSWKGRISGGSKFFLLQRAPKYANIYFRSLVQKTA